MTKDTTRPPRTEAGRRLQRELYVADDNQLRRGILAIEAEAAAPDAGLRKAAQEWANLCHDYDLNEKGQAVMGRLRAALAAHRSSDPSPALPPCPICGKDDLFMGTDGRPGCPHCEVAVKLGAAPAGPAVHMKQSGNGCVTCSRKWSRHTDAEKRGAAGPAVDRLRFRLRRLPSAQDRVNAERELDEALAAGPAVPDYPDGVIADDYEGD